MTEVEWLASIDPQEMLDSLGAIPTDRKLRLFACACCHIRAGLLTEPQHHSILSVAERLADGLATIESLRTEREHLLGSQYALWAATQEDPYLAATTGSRDLAIHAGQDEYPELNRDCDLAEKLSARDSAYACEAKTQSRLLRDIFGSPFGSVALDPRWLTADVVALARGIYDDRAFDRLPILADALIDAGCDNEDILTHCRSDGPHVRGCWVVDLVLGKS